MIRNESHAGVGYPLNHLRSCTRLQLLDVGFGSAAYILNGASQYGRVGRMRGMWHCERLADPTTQIHISYMELSVVRLSALHLITLGYSSCINPNTNVT